jgi:hypothetical protein
MGTDEKDVSGGFSHPCNPCDPWSSPSQLGLIAASPRWDLCVLFRLKCFFQVQGSNGLRIADADRKIRDRKMKL